MPAVLAQPLIEQAQWSGWAPDPDDTFEDPSLLVDVLNLLPDLGESDALVTRKGFAQFVDTAVAGGHYIKHIRHFLYQGTAYLILVLSDDTNAANNVQLWAVNMDAVTAARIDTAGRNWAKPDKNHWGLSIQETFYGGSPGNEVYSWNPDDGWNAAANTATFDTVVDSTSPGAGEVARDYAFKDRERVEYNSKLFSPVSGIRFDKWTDESHYQVGQRVSKKGSYWRSYRCIAAHDPATAATEPDVGASWKDYWQRVRLPLPQNADNETSKKWYFVPKAPGSSVAQWHADRLWIRYDGQGDKSRVLYSAPVKPEKHADVPDTVFDMTDFRPGDDNSGPGGGWLPFNDGAHEGVVEALWSYNSYLLVFKRQSIWTLSGASDETFTVRRLSRHVGAVGPDCVVELDGLVYFLSDDGLYVTDGTAVEPVEGMERIRQTLVARIDDMHAEGAAGNRRDPVVWTYNSMVWCALPVDGDTLTLVYDPRSKTFWRLNLPVLAAQTARSEGTQHVYFAKPTGTAVQLYSTNKDGNSEIAWSMSTAWWPFGVHHQERRVRRVWAVVKGAMTYTLLQYRNWTRASAVATSTAVVAATTPTYIEGKWQEDSHAIALKLSSTKAPAVVYGMAVDTEPRRVRYGA